MFGRDGVQLRPLVPADLETIYQWENNIGANVRSGWSRPQSLAAFVESREERWCTPTDALQVYAIAAADEFVGYAQLAAILRSHEVHNGARQDMVVYGLLKSEFLDRYTTMFDVSTVLQAGGDA